MSKKISELIETIEPATNDVLPIVSEGETKKITLANIINAIKTVLNNAYASITHTHTKDEIEETDPTVPTHVKSITEENISAWNNKSDFSGDYEDLDNKPIIPSEYELPKASSTTLGGIKVGANLTIAEDGTLNATGGGGEGGTTDYIALSNKPKINGVELTGDKTSEELGITSGSGASNILTFENVSVTTTSFVEDATYEEFGYKAEIPCTGVTADFFSDVTFDVAEAISGNYAPISKTGAGTVTIYAVEQPESTITIPSIICSKGA